MKFRKIFAGLLAAVLLVMGFTVTVGAESISDTAKAIKSGTQYMATLDFRDTAAYKVTLNKSGSLKIKVKTTGIKQTELNVYDSAGNLLTPTNYDSTIGYASGPSYVSTTCQLLWNETVEKFSGTYIYELNKGTYYIKFENITYFAGKLAVTATFPSSDSSKTSPYLTLTVKKGGTVDLGVAATSDSVTWSTSKSSVATVNQSGMVTAKKAGSAIIKAKTGGKTLKIKIVVK